MRVKVIVEFEVEALDLSKDEHLTENEGKDAANLAVFHNLALTGTGESIVCSATHHVDGFGPCVVRLVEP